MTYKNKANIGDIIRIDGEEGRLFRVECWTYEVEVTPELIEEDIIYDVSDVITSEFSLAFEEDVDVVLANKDAPTKYLPELLREQAQEMEPTPKAEPADEPTVDELLDQLNDVNALIELFGEHEDDERRDRRYILMKTELEAKLVEATAGGGNE